MAPPFMGNPYLSLLADAITEVGWDVDIPASRTGLRRSSDLPEVIHLHWERFWTVDTSMRRAIRRTQGLLRDLVTSRLRGSRIVWTVHNLRDHDAPHPWFERLAQVLLSVVAHVVVVHHGPAVAPVRRRLLRLRRPVVVVPHGRYPLHRRIDCEAARSELGIHDDSLLLASVGSVRPYKRVDVIIDAVMRCTNDVSLVLAGDAEDRVRQALERRIGAHPRFRLLLRHVSDDELSVVLAASDALVLASREQLTSGSAVLAISHGRPVLHGGLPHVSSVCPDGGSVVVDVSTADDLSRTLSELRREDLRAEAGRMSSCTLPSWSDVAATLVEGAYRSHRKPAPGSLGSSQRPVQDVGTEGDHRGRL